MTKKQRAQVEERLLAERERALAALARFDEEARVSMQEDDGDLSTYPLHLADEGTDTVEQEQKFVLASKEGRQLYGIDAALRRLYREPEEFGRCTECGGEIGYERLEIVPWAELCIECQRTEEENRLREAA